MKDSDIGESTANDCTEDTSSSGVIPSCVDWICNVGVMEDEDEDASLDGYGDGITLATADVAMAMDALRTIVAFDH